MQKITARPGSMLQLGRAGETGVRQVVFDLSGWLAELGPGHAALVVELPDDDRRYPIPIADADGVAIWTITAAETAVPGYGQAQLSYLVEDKVAKTQIYQTWVEASLSSTEDTPPEAQQGWVDRVLASGVQAQTAAESADRSRLAAQLAEGTARGYVGAAKEQADRAAAAARGLIDDRRLSTEHAASSKHTADLLGEPFCLSGPVVTCQPVEGYPLEVVSHIVPRQEGEGDPSRTNIREIMPWMGAALTRSGENRSEDYAVEFGRPIYGGRYNWTTGELTITHKKVHSRDINFFAVNDPSNPALCSAFALLPDIGMAEKGEDIPIYCNKYKTVMWAQASNQTGACVWRAAASYGVLVPYAELPGITPKSSDAEKLQALAQYMGEYELVFDVAAPVTVKLSPTEVPALSGTNTLHSDTGDTTVKGVSRPAAGLAERIAALEAAVLSIGGRA